MPQNCTYGTPSKRQVKSQVVTDVLTDTKLSAYETNFTPPNHGLVNETIHASPPGITLQNPFEQAIYYKH